MHASYRSIVFAAAFVAAGSIVWNGAWAAVAAARIGRVSLAQDLHLVVGKLGGALISAREDERIAFIGDSTLLHVKEMTTRRQSLPARVVQALRKTDRGQRIALRSLPIPGLGPSAFYFLTDSLIGARPSSVVLGFNMHSLGTTAMHQFGYAEAAGLMSWRQVPQALLLPTYAFGLTADQVLLYKTIESSGGLAAWKGARQLQSRFFKLRNIVANGVDAQVGTHAFADMQFALGNASMQETFVPGRDRFSRPMATRFLGPLVQGLSSGHPGLRVLRSALDRLRDAGIPALVYIEPMNVEHLRAVGVQVDLSASILTLRATVEGAGAHLVDYSSLLPDAAFRDAGDHYTFDGDPNGTNWLGDRIAYAILKALPAPRPLQAARSLE